MGERLVQPPNVCGTGAGTPVPSSNPRLTWWARTNSRQKISNNTQEEYGHDEKTPWDLSP